MIELLSYGTSRVFVQGSSMMISDGAVCYLYCLECGGLKLCHSYLESDMHTAREERELIRASSATCSCRPTPIPAKSTVQRVLSSLYINVGTCNTVEEARQMIMLAASQEDMKD